jgi:hypothetical protein
VVPVAMAQGEPEPLQDNASARLEHLCFLPDGGGVDSQPVRHKIRT